MVEIGMREWLYMIDFLPGYAIFSLHNPGALFEDQDGLQEDPESAENRIPHEGQSFGTGTRVDRTVG